MHFKIGTKRQGYSQTVELILRYTRTARAFVSNEILAGEPAVSGVVSPGRQVYVELADDLRGLTLAIHLASVRCLDN